MKASKTSLVRTPIKRKAGYMDWAVQDKEVEKARQEVKEKEMMARG